MAGFWLAFVCAIAAYCIFSTVAAQNSTSRNYTVGVQVSDIWYSGSADTLYITLCHRTTTNNATSSNNCLKWLAIDNGMQSRGAWYTFEYVNQTDIGVVDLVKLVTYENDQFCMQAVSVDGVTFTSSEAIGFQCMDVSDEAAAGTCSVVDAILDDSATVFNGELYEGTACANVGLIDTSASNVVAREVIPAEPGTRTYELSLTVSNYPFSGTVNDLYMRLCVDETRQNCTQKCLAYDDPDTSCTNDWFLFAGGVREEGNTYKGYWNTKDLGDVGYADIVIFGADMFCLSRLEIDGVDANAGSLPECISDESQLGCGAISVDLNNEVFSTSSAEQCSYGINSNDTFVEVQKYVFKFATSSVIGCGAEATIFFAFCTVDGSYQYPQFCSEVYQINTQLPDSDTEYTFTVDVSEYSRFNTISDVYSVDLWAYETEMWCLSDVTLNGITADGEAVLGPNADSGTFSVQMSTDVDDGKFCEGVTVNLVSSQFAEFSDGPYEAITECRWNAKIAANGTIEINEEPSDGAFNPIEWTAENPAWVAGGAVAIVCLCILCGVCCQRIMKKHKEVAFQDSDKSGSNWHGGNSAFY
eukprot:CAMPEP_0202731408 /NCGR_PEP_ID=MMETSP1385-20130828/187133_1 /ASSEMBLY_ACC=CAM_ASM_000861 /TAXON_ID=933848 /ORGANISM="Elphidium margaritaceum" /LENGTH=584 /DNA_ID=CAMNT_0049397705 /DNA_START=32 /DNA_END=1786 /DNA_ORIENTATION=-